MKAIVKAAAIPAALLLAAGCEVNVDNETAASLDNVADEVGADLGNAIDDTANAAGRVGEAVENGAAELDNRVDIDVRTGADADAGAAEANSQ